MHYLFVYIFNQKYIKTPQTKYQHAHFMSDLQSQRLGKQCKTEHFHSIGGLFFFIDLGNNMHSAEMITVYDQMAFHLSILSTSDNDE